MNGYISTVGAIALLATVASPRSEVIRPLPDAVSPCMADSNYQRLAFWVGDWEVVDSNGVHYATQRVHPVLDGCAITVDWTGGVGDKGMSIAAFDAKASEWKQVYASNQVPAPAGVTFRTSDPTYRGPGVRFIPLADPSRPMLAQTRVTIMPLTGGRALQLFEDTNDGGKHWMMVFKAEHRPIR